MRFAPELASSIAGHRPAVLVLRSEQDSGSSRKRVGWQTPRLTDALTAATTHVAPSETAAGDSAGRREGRSQRGHQVQSWSSRIPACRQDSCAPENHQGAVRVGVASGLRTAKSCVRRVRDRTGDSQSSFTRSQMIRVAQCGPESRCHVEIEGSWSRAILGTSTPGARRDFRRTLGISTRSDL